MPKDELGGEAGGFVVREFRASLEDAIAATEILQEAREAASWSEKLLREGVAGNSNHVFMSERAGLASGFIFGRVAVDEGEILNLAVRQAYRRSGEGTALVRRLLGVFAERGVRRVFLEVRESNRVAIAFYQRLGFLESGRRKDYYHDPVEAALVLSLEMDPVIGRPVSLKSTD